MKRKKLVIISHTEHFYKNGEVVGWGPTVNEINYLSAFWDEVLHVGCLYDTDAPLSSKIYTNRNTQLIPLPPTGGKRFWNKLNIIWNLPITLRKIFKSVQGATDVQFRSPTGIGVYILPAFSFLFRRDYNFWVKYAGNWAQAKPPAGYRIQRWWLKRNLAKCKVTINGFWEDQPEHCLSFENPCLTGEDISKGKIIHSQKKFKPPFRLVFVGRLEDAKGVGRILDAMKKTDLNLIERLDFIGDGAKRKEYEEQASFLGNKAVFYGFLNKSDVHKLLAEGHFFLLPSSSEGFPKVIAEAACYGCIPIVSNVGSIGHYVNNETNGFIWEINGNESFSVILEKGLSATSDEIKQKSENILQLAEMFTFENYKRKLETNILNI